jgi:hypothetical protein
LGLHPAESDQKKHMNSTPKLCSHELSQSAHRLTKPSLVVCVSSNNGRG